MAAPAARIQGYIEQIAELRVQIDKKTVQKAALPVRSDGRKKVERELDALLKQQSILKQQLQKANPAEFAANLTTIGVTYKAKKAPLPPPLALALVSDSESSDETDSESEEYEKGEKEQKEQEIQEAPAYGERRAVPREYGPGDIAAPGYVAAGYVAAGNVAAAAANYVVQKASNLNDILVQKFYPKPLDAANLPQSILAAPAVNQLPAPPQTPAPQILAAPAQTPATPADVPILLEPIGAIAEAQPSAPAAPVEKDLRNRQNVIRLHVPKDRVLYILNSADVKAAIKERIAKISAIKDKTKKQNAENRRRAVELYNQGKTTLREHPQLVLSQLFGKNLYPVETGFVVVVKDNIDGIFDFIETLVAPIFELWGENQKTKKFATVDNFGVYYWTNTVMPLLTELLVMLHAKSEQEEGIYKELWSPVREAILFIIMKCMSNHESEDATRNILIDTNGSIQRPKMTKPSVFIETLTFFEKNTPAGVIYKQAVEPEKFNYYTANPTIERTVLGQKETKNQLVNDFDAREPGSAGEEPISGSRPAIITMAFLIGRQFSKDKKLTSAAWQSPFDLQKENVSFEADDEKNDRNKTTYAFVDQRKNNREVVSDFNSYDSLISRIFALPLLELCFVDYLNVIIGLKEDTLQFNLTNDSKTKFARLSVVAPYNFSPTYLQIIEAPTLTGFFADFPSAVQTNLKRLDFTDVVDSEIPDKKRKREAAEANIAKIKPKKDLVFADFLTSNFAFANAMQEIANLRELWTSVEGVRNLPLRETLAYRIIGTILFTPFTDTVTGDTTTFFDRFGIRPNIEDRQLQTSAKPTSDAAAQQINSEFGLLKQANRFLSKKTLGDKIVDALTDPKGTEFRQFAEYVQQNSAVRELLNDATTKKTVLIPTDEALSAFQSKLTSWGTSEAYFQEEVAKAIKLHVLEGEFDLESLKPGMTLEAKTNLVLQRDKPASIIYFTLLTDCGKFNDEKGGFVSIKSDVYNQEKDIVKLSGSTLAKNGVYYTIGRVLLPPIQPPISINQKPIIGTYGQVPPTQQIEQFTNARGDYAQTKASNCDGSVVVVQRFTYTELRTKNAADFAPMREFLESTGVLEEIRKSTQAKIPLHIYAPIPVVLQAAAKAATDAKASTEDLAKLARAHVGIGKWDGGASLSEGAFTPKDVAALHKKQSPTEIATLNPEQSITFAGMTEARAPENSVLVKESDFERERGEFIYTPTNLTGDAVDFNEKQPIYVHFINRVLTLPANEQKRSNSSASIAVADKAVAVADAVARKKSSVTAAEPAAPAVAEQQVAPAAGTDETRASMAAAGSWYNKVVETAGKLQSEKDGSKFVAHVEALDAHLDELGGASKLSPAQTSAVIQQQRKALTTAISKNQQIDAQFRAEARDAINKLYDRFPQ